jgi:hypothetical protein
MAAVPDLLVDPFIWEPEILRRPITRMHPARADPLLLRAYRYRAAGARNRRGRERRVSFPGVLRNEPGRTRIRRPKRSRLRRRRTVVRVGVVRAVQRFFIGTPKPQTKSAAWRQIPHDANGPRTSMGAELEG